jgi:cytochrome c-type biogenesis protein CcmH/NrfF
VAQFGEQILAAPPKHGFDLLAWVVPGAALALGAAVAATLAWVWSRSRRGPPGGDAAGLDPAMDARIDADLAGFE